MEIIDEESEWLAYKSKYPNLASMPYAKEIWMAGFLRAANFYLKQMAGMLE